MSTAYMPTPDPESAPSSAGARRTARGIPGNDYVRPARATGGSRLDPPPAPLPEGPLRWERREMAPVPNRAPIPLPAAAPSRPASAVREVAGSRQTGVAPAT